jgi:hypothetical protein
MERERRSKYLLGGLIVVFIGVLAWTWNQSTIPLPSSNGSAPRSQTARRGRAGGAGGLDVHLKALDEAHAKPGSDVRNLFRYKTKPVPPPPPPRSAATSPAEPAPPPVSTGPAAPPPIALKFIGLVQTPDKSQRLAVLSDGRGPVPIYGKEGDIIEGRYRIVRIGAESVELAYLDGRGRQTIRLSGG